MADNMRKSKKNNMLKRFPFGWIFALIIFILIINSFNIPITGVPREMSYSGFYQILKNNPEKIKSVTKIETVIQGELTDNSRFFVNIPENDPELLNLMRQNLEHFDVKPPRTFWVSLIFNLGPIMLLIFFWWMMAARGEQIGNRILTFGKVRPKVHSPTEKVTFNDVAGVDEAKEELKEVIEFLKDPKKFQRLGGKIPKGVLLVGPPGCGKTLIARAVAGEAEVPFFSISGSDFVEMFVGVGASRVRDLFDQGRRASKVSGKGAIIFIDEIDAVGRLRFSGIGGGHDEREQTLNALLVEMDGFDAQQGIILIAASVTGDTPILINDHGKIDIVNIGDFVDKLYESQEEGVLKDVEEIYTLGYQKKTGYSIYGNKFKAACFQPVKAAYRHKVDHIYVVKYRGGAIRATGEHSVFISYHGGIKPMRVDQLKKGDVLVDLPYKANRTNPTKELRAFGKKTKLDKKIYLDVIPDYEEIIEKYEYVMSNPDNLSQTQLSKKIGVAQTTIGEWQREISRPRHIGAQEYKVKIPPRIEVTKDFLRLLGYYTSEGCIESKRHRITFSFNKKEGEKIEEVKDLMRKIFGVNSPYISHPEENETCIAYKNRHLANFFTNLIGFGSRTQRLPSFFFELPKEDFLEFLKGFWLGDGYEDKVGRFYATTVNRHLALQISWLCRMHGIKVNLRKSFVPERYIKGMKLNPTTAYVLEIGKRNNPFKPKSTTHMKKARVLEVRKEEFKGYVYDLCGCENEAFFGGENPILLHNTNRPDTLDPAILRPGRFDRNIIVNFPDIKGREEILKVHIRKIKLSPNVDLKSIASQTPGFSGADLANLCNEAALLAARYNKDAVEMIDFEKSVERVLMGPEKKSHIMSKKEKEITALHESGHALMSLLLAEVNPVKKVSIIPRGLAGGYTFTPPLEDRHYWTKKELIAEIALVLGGRVSEEINLSEVTTGAQNDLEMATQMARRMVTQFGMSEKLGNITLGRREGLIFLGRDIMEEKNYSEETARLIDEEVKKIVDEAYIKAKTLLQQSFDKLKILSNALLEKESLDGEEVKRLLGIEKKDLT